MKTNKLTIRINKPVSDSETELEYLEWATNGELSSPFPISALQKLKEVMEVM